MPPAPPPSGETAEAAFTQWLRRLFAFLPSKRLIVAELLEHVDRGDPVLRGNRERALRPAGRC